MNDPVLLSRNGRSGQDRYGVVWLCLVNPGTAHPHTIMGLHWPARVLAWPVNDNRPAPEQTV
jgi:hypothetical protein